MSSKHIVAILSAVLFISYFIIGSSFLLLIGLILGALAAYLYFSDGKKSGKNAEPQQEEPATDKASDPTENLLNQNLTLRKARIADDVLQAYEALIDQLLRVWPRISASTPEGELAWVVNRMATEYLPNKSITPYINMPKAERTQAGDSVVESLQGMSSELTEIEQMLDDQVTGEFDRKAKFLKQRFFKES